MFHPGSPTSGSPTYAAVAEVGVRIPQLDRWGGGPGSRQAVFACWRGVSAEVWVSGPETCSGQSYSVRNASIGSTRTARRAGR
jgi:hypothetical protein